MRRRDPGTGAAAVVAELDCLCSLAAVAVKNNYCCPVVDESGVIEIHDGRHPVVECMRPDAMFVPNDTYMGEKENRAAIITGPNMAGKSTYMRQVALMVLMAQIGSFVPAKAPASASWTAFSPASAPPTTCRRGSPPLWWR